MKRNLGAALLKAIFAASAAFSFSFATTLPEPGFPATRPALQLWYWHHSNSTTDAAVVSSKALIDRAVKLGYTGVAFWDDSFAYLSDSFWPKANIDRLQEVLRYATSKGLQVMGSAAPFGWSNGALAANGNLGEAQPVLGARFVVDSSRKQLTVLNDLPPLRNAGFEEGRSAWFGTGDSAIGVGDTGHGGRHSGVVVDARGNARFRQRVALTPWRQYHLSLWFKSSRFHGSSVVEVQDWWHRDENRFYFAIPATGNRGWTKLEFLFDSRNTQSAYLYFGVWGGSSGLIWFDDVQLEETAPVYVARRPGAPLRMYDPEDSRTSYREGQDFNYVSDPVLSPPKAAFRDVYHSPVRIGLPAGSRLRAGQAVTMDFCAVFPLGKDQQVGMCLTEPAVFRWLGENGRALRTVMPPDNSVLLGYDEMRQMNSCASCRAKQMTAGALLAWNVQKTADIYKALMPGAPLYIWSDMFDPYHNAKKQYFYVYGDLAGSWKGLPPQIGVLNWNHAHLRQSLAWFAGADARQPVPHKQILAGYYDTGKGSSAADDLNVADGIPGLQGIMYVTWVDDYTQLDSFARSARSAWKSYLTSVRN